MDAEDSCVQSHKTKKAFQKHPSPDTKAPPFLFFSPRHQAAAPFFQHLFSFCFRVSLIMLRKGRDVEKLSPCSFFSPKFIREGCGELCHVVYVCVSYSGASPSGRFRLHKVGVQGQSNAGERTCSLCFLTAVQHHGKGDALPSGAGAQGSTSGSQSARHRGHLSSGSMQCRWYTCEHLPCTGAHAGPGKQHLGQHSLRENWHTAHVSSLKSHSHRATACHSVTRHCSRPAPGTPVIPLSLFSDSFPVRVRALCLFSPSPFSLSLSLCVPDVGRLQ